MSLTKRHIGRRVAGVGVGVALMVLGLEAPAMAAPAVTSFTPTTGPVGTSVTITGTGLGSATSVKFNGKAATITSNTGTQIVTKVPAGATTGPITVTTAGGTATSRYELHRDRPVPRSQYLPAAQ